MKKYRSAEIAAEWWADKLRHPDISDIENMAPEEVLKFLEIATYEIDLERFPDEAQLQIFKNELEARINIQLQTKENVFLFSDREANCELADAAKVAGIYSGKKGCFYARLQMHVSRDEVLVSKDDDKYECYYIESVNREKDKYDRTK